MLHYTYFNYITITLMNNLKQSQRALEPHQGFTNLDTFKFVLHIDN